VVSVETAVRGRLSGTLVGGTCESDGAGSLHDSIRARQQARVVRV